MSNLPLSMSVFQSGDILFFRKPAGVASTRGKQRCFLSLLETNSALPEADFTLLGGSSGEQLFENQLQHLEIHAIETSQPIVKSLLSQFSAEQEYGLLNRLDTDTSGLLYFAKTPEVFEQFSQRQSAGEIRKYYLARIRGDPLRNLAKRDMPFTDQQDARNFSLSFPIMHHTHNDEMMIVFRDEVEQEAGQHKGRGEVHLPTTQIEVLHYDEQKNESVVLAMITKGVRHQIRVHLAALGNPILGDKLYNKQMTEAVLQLVSCGCEIDT